MNEPEKCGPTCPQRGKWGATGVMPPGHHIHYFNGGGYLAHGNPSEEDLRRMVDLIHKEFEVAVARARARYTRKMDAILPTEEQP